MPSYKLLQIMMFQSPRIVLNGNLLLLEMLLAFLNFELQGQTARLFLLFVKKCVILNYNNIESIFIIAYSFNTLYV